MPSPAMVLRSCFIDLELVSYPLVASQLPPCFVSSMPDEPDVAICLFDMPGRMFGKDARTGKRVAYPGVSIKVRGVDYFSYDLANSLAVAVDQDMAPIKTTLPQQDGETEHYIQNVIRLTTILSLGEEVGTRRELWSFNTRIAFEQIEPSIG